MLLSQTDNPDLNPNRYPTRIPMRNPNPSLPK